MATKRRAAKRSRPASKKASRTYAVAANPKKSVAQRVAALAEDPLAVCESDANLQSVINVLRDPEQPVKVRLAALQALQAAAFSVIAFEECRKDYIAALRAIATDDDAEIRQRALGLLARNQDGYAQKKLIEGLRKPEKALVPPEKALQLLGYDPHAEAYAIARDIVSAPPNPTAKREALRLLAADAKSAPIFERMLRDKKEAPEIRQISAAALHGLKPQKLQAYAREIVLDKSEPPELQAMSLTALSSFGDSEAVAGDETLVKRAEALSSGKSKVKTEARRLLKTAGR